jgi:hypothetical protein
MITRVLDIPSDKIMTCNWVIITHKLGDYLFSNNDCYKKGKQICLIKCGGSIGYKINGKFRSLTWIAKNKKPCIEVYASNIELLPF